MILTGYPCRESAVVSCVGRAGFKNITACGFSGLFFFGGLASEKTTYAEALRDELEQRVFVWSVAQSGAGHMHGLGGENTVTHCSLVGLE